MTPRIASVEKRASGPAALFLQIVGLAGTNHVLTALLPWLPGYASSRLQGQLELFGHADLYDLAQLLLTSAVLPGLVEELLFRGLLFALLLRFRGPTWAIWGSAVAFGLIHVDPLHIGMATILGLQLGFIRHLHGLGLAITAHVINNALILMIRFAAEAPGFEAYSFQAGPISALIAALLAGSAWAALLQQGRSKGAAAEPLRTTLQTTDELDESG